MTALDAVLTLALVLSAFAAAAALMWVRRTKARLRAEATAEWTWAVDLQGTILASSESCLGAIGYTAEELVGQNVSTIMNPRELLRAETMVRAAGVPEEGLDNLIVSATHRDGSSSWFEVYVRPELDESGAMVACRGVSRRIGPEAAQVVASRATRSRIQHIIDNRLLITAFQPIVDVRTGSVLGVEALSRMVNDRSPRPDTWFAEATSVGLGTDLELLAVETALAAAVALPSELYVSVNVSPESCLDTRLAAMIQSSSIDPRRLVLEVTEHSQVLDYSPLNAALCRFRQLGIRIAVDDAGAGFASGQHIIKIRPDIIKLDRSIISAIDVESDQRALAAGFVAFAAHIGAVVTAEGIETATEAMTVATLGIRCAQGYLFGQATVDVRVWTGWSGPGPQRPPLPGPPAVTDSATTGVLVGPAVLDALPDPTAVVDGSGVIIAVNRAWLTFTATEGGDPESTGVGTNYLDVCARSAAAGSAEASEAYASLRAVLSGAAVVRESEYSCHSSDTNRWFASRISAIEGGGAGAVVSHVNVTRRKRSEEELLHQSSYDPVTGLISHLLFNRRLAESLRSVPDQLPGHTVGVISIGLEGLLVINEAYGNAASDEVLLAAAERLASLIRPQDSVARIGRDRFAVCAPDISGAALLSMADRISTTLSRPYPAQGRRVTVAVGVGSHLAAAGVDPAEAIRAADHDLYSVEQPHQRSTLARPAPA